MAQFIMQLTKITKGAACFQCRKIKTKCDAEKPTCSRCQRRRLGCVYPTGIAKRTSLTAPLEARALELEITIHKLTLSSIHNLSLVSARLLKRSTHLGESFHLPHWHSPATAATAWAQTHMGSEGTIGLTSVLQQDMPQSGLTFGLPAGFERLPQSSSLHLIRLAHCLYLLDQTLPAVGNYTPSFPYDNQWQCIPEAETPLGHQDRQDPNEMKQPISEPRESQTDFRISMARTFKRVAEFVRSVHEQGDYRLDEEYDDLVAQMSDEHLTIPPMSDITGSSSLENPSASKSYNIFEHTTPYGSGLILYSLRAGKDLEARRKLLHCVQALVDICRYASVHKNSGKVQIGFANLFHIMNAIRVIARELRQPETSRDVMASLSYCASIETLLDFIDDVVSLWPAWSNSPAMLKDTLTTTLTLLATQFSIPRGRLI
ncbi:hypothetical protein DL93DRAFT_2098163 [Clavulina sp. PMI_390]|nr:hypothetical protein DL93DRAFT_2098163 [Clavulina sp. PMI_390]